MYGLAGSFLILLLVLFGAAFVRKRQTPPTHPDYAARADMVRLVAVLLIGQALVLIRLRFPVRSAAFLIGTLLLLPVVGATLWLLVRLWGAYRRSR